MVNLAQYRISCLRMPLRVWFYQVIVSDFESNFVIRTNG